MYIMGKGSYANQLTRVNKNGWTNQGLRECNVNSIVKKRNSQETFFSSPPWCCMKYIGPREVVDARHRQFTRHLEYEFGRPSRSLQNACTKGFTARWPGFPSRVGTWSSRRRTAKGECLTTTSEDNLGAQRYKRRWRRSSGIITKRYFF
jgi:hypothetical protein